MYFTDDIERGLREEHTEVFPSCIFLPGDYRQERAFVFAYFKYKRCNSLVQSTALLLTTATACVVFESRIQLASSFRDSCVECTHHPPQEKHPLQPRHYSLPLSSSRFPLSHPSALLPSHIKGCEVGSRDIFGSGGFLISDTAKV